MSKFIPVYRAVILDISTEVFINLEEAQKYFEDVKKYCGLPKNQCPELLGLSNDPLNEILIDEECAKREPKYRLATIFEDNK